MRWRRTHEVNRPAAHLAIEWNVFPSLNEPGKEGDRALDSNKCCSYFAYFSVGSRESIHVDVNDRRAGLRVYNRCASLTLVMFLKCYLRIGERLTIC